MSSDCHSFRVIYENEDLVVVNKPHDVPMDGEEYPITVEKWALSHLENASRMTSTNKNENTSLNANNKPMDGKKRVKFVHQLDYATSGVLCVAFSREMAARLSHCFEMRTTQKAYLAILRGIIPPLKKESTCFCCSCDSNSENDRKGISAGVECCSESTYSNAVHIVTLDEVPNADFIHQCINDAASSNSNKEKNNNNEEMQTDELSSSSASSLLIAIDLPVGYDESDPGGFRMSVNGRDARESLTYMYILQRGYIQHPTEKQTTVPVTKVILIPRTGRRHQLRVHCHALGFPILGDVTYDAIASPQIGVIKTAEGKEEEEKAAITKENRNERNRNNITMQANSWERMMLHAWRLSFPVSVELLRCGMERYMQKRKRRRVRLGLEAAISNETPLEWTHFKTEDPFVDYISESPL